MADLADTIRNIPLFAGLSREDVAKIMGHLVEVEFARWDKIFSQGDSGDALYLIQSGAAHVQLDSGGGRSETIAVLGPREYFGEMALLSSALRLYRPIRRQFLGSRSVGFFILDRFDDQFDRLGVTGAGSP